MTLIWQYVTIIRLLVNQLDHLKLNLPNNVLSIYCTITIKTSITNHDITASVSFTHKHALKCYALAEEHYDYFMALPYVNNL